MAFQNLKNEIKKTVKLKEKPYSIAVGAAIGVFWNFIPSLGVGWILSFIAAKLLKVSKVAAVTINLATAFFIPFFYSLNVLSGKALTGVGFSLTEAEGKIGTSFSKSVENIKSAAEKPESFFHLDTLQSLSMEFLVGSVINAFLALTIISLVMWYILRMRKNKKNSKEDSFSEKCNIYNDA